MQNAQLVEPVGSPKSPIVVAAPRVHFHASFGALGPVSLIDALCATAGVRQPVSGADAHAGGSLPGGSTGGSGGRITTPSGDSSVGRRSSRFVIVIENEPFDARPYGELRPTSSSFAT